MNIRKPDTNPIKPIRRNRTDLSISNGFEFGIGFWLASVLVLVFGVPILTCVALMAIAVLGRLGQ
jgi:hypothetical protein